MERILEVIRQELQENPSSSSSSSSSSVSSTKLSSPSVASSSRVTNNLKNITSNNSSITDPTPSAVQLIKASSAYPLHTLAPSAISHEYLCQQHPELVIRIQKQRQSILNLLSLLVPKIEAGSTTVQNIVKPLVQYLSLNHKDTYQEEPDIQPLLEFLDRLRETTEIAIDEAKGQTTNQQIMILQQQQSSSSNNDNNSSHQSKVRHTNTVHRKGIPIALAMTKPQFRFTPLVDNSRYTKFLPPVPVHGLPCTNNTVMTTIKNNPTTTTSSSSNTNNTITTNNHETLYTHPYKHFIDHLPYPEPQLDRADPVASFVSLEDNEYDYIDTIDDLQSLCHYLEGKFDDPHTVTDLSSSSSSSSYSSSVSKSFFSNNEPPNLRYGPRTPVREIAIDLEAHSYRSFQGFTCLMQLSTRERDFVIDTIALRSHLHLLNTVTTDPRVVKVLHGSDSDIVWLQRDFGIYIVNIFDTGQASRILAYPSYSLAYLLDLYPQITAAKQYQTADWRQRPLPPELLKYAREDTHYLLGIYDRLKNELINNSSSSIDLPVLPEKVLHLGYTSATKDIYQSIVNGNDQPNVKVPSLLVEALRRSADKSLFLYEKEAFYPYGYRKVMLKLGIGSVGGSDIPTTNNHEDIDDAMDTNTNNDEENTGSDERQSSTHHHSLSSSTNDSSNNSVLPAEDLSLNPQARVFAALYDWRDRVARDEDESIPYVLSNRVLARITSMMPTTVDLLIQTCNPLPPLVRSRMDEIVRIINAAREGIPLGTDVVNTNTRNQGIIRNNNQNNNARNTAAGQKRKLVADSTVLVDNQSFRRNPSQPIPIVERVTNTSQAMDQILNILMKISMINNDLLHDETTSSLLPLSVKENGGWLQSPKMNHTRTETTNLPSTSVTTSSLFTTFASNSSDDEDADENTDASNTSKNNNAYVQSLQIAQDIKENIHKQSWKELLGIESILNISPQVTPASANNPTEKTNTRSNQVDTTTTTGTSNVSSPVPSTSTTGIMNTNEILVDSALYPSNVRNDEENQDTKDTTDLPLSLSQKYANPSRKKRKQENKQKTDEAMNTNRNDQSSSSSATFNYDQVSQYGLQVNNINAKSAKLDMEVEKKVKDKKNLGKRSNQNYVKKNPFLRR